MKHRSTPTDSTVFASVTITVDGKPHEVQLTGNPEGPARLFRLLAEWAQGMELEGGRDE